MLEDTIKFCLDEMSNRPFSNLAVANINFKDLTYELFQIENGKLLLQNTPIFFDLASLTKPLTLGAAYIMYPELFSTKELLLLNHKAGLPAWGRLSKSSWRKQIMSYEISAADTLYSDFSALRLMLELEEKKDTSLYDLVKTFWDRDVTFWKDLPFGFRSVVTGERSSRPIYGEVHDDNAFVINKFCSHAGLFGTINGVSKSLLNLHKQFGFVDLLKNKIDKSLPEDRYVGGWDRVLDMKTTLAGKGATLETFGHTGFTGTSIWIEPESLKGTVILSNFTSYTWFDRSSFNSFRKNIGLL